MPKNLVSRDGFSRPVPRQPAHPHTQAESGAYLRDSSRVPRRRPFMKPPYAIGSFPSLSGHAIAYRWRSLPRVRRHRASTPQGSSERVLPWQITMDQLIFASLSHTHYWYEVGMLKVPVDLSNANPAYGHKEVRRSTDHIMAATRYSDQQGFKSRQKVMRIYKQWHRPMSKRFIKPPYSISRATSIDSDCCRLPSTSVLGNKSDKLRSN